MRVFCFQLLTLAIMALSFSARADSGRTASANNEFSFKLYQQLSGSSKENVFISPYSIYAALSLAYAGAEGNTKAEFKNTMGISDPQSFHDEMARNMESLNERNGKGFSISVANALWLDKQTSVLNSYRGLLKKYYRTYENSFDKTESGKAAKKVNDWVSEKTRNKIKSLVTPDNMRASDLVLTNAIYFKGDWWQPFKKEATEDSDFKLFSGQPLKVKMMHQASYFNYQEINGVKFLELPYKESELSMILVLPEKAGSEALAAAEKNLAGSFNKFDVTKSTEQFVNLSFPKFKIEPELLMLNTQLQELGIKDAFVYPRADFSGINGNKELVIGVVAHKAMINVDEKGTEAAAATAISMLAGAAMNPEEPEEFTADRPFIYLIRDKKTGLVLFIGKLLNPTSV